MKRLKVVATALFITLSIPTCVIFARTHVSEQKTVMYYANIEIGEGDTLWSIAQVYKSDKKKIHTPKSDLI